MKYVRHLLLIGILTLASLANAQQLKVLKDTVDYKLMEVEKMSLDSLINLKAHIDRTHWHDSSINENYYPYILICNQIKKINPKAAKEVNVDYCLADAYYTLKQYDKAIEYSKIYLKVPAKNTSREGLGRLNNKKWLCYNLCEIYKERHDTLTAVKYLLEIEKHYFYGWHYSSPKGWRGVRLYKEIVELYTVLNDKKSIAKYQKKIDMYDKE